MKGKKVASAFESGNISESSDPHSKETNGAFADILNDLHKKHIETKEPQDKMQGGSDVENKAPITPATKAMKKWRESIKSEEIARVVKDLFNFAYDHPDMDSNEIAESEWAQAIRVKNYRDEALKFIKKERAEIKKTQEKNDTETSAETEDLAMIDPKEFDEKLDDPTEESERSLALTRTALPEEVPPVIFLPENAGKNEKKDTYKSNHDEVIDLEEGVDYEIKKEANQETSGAEEEVKKIPGNKKTAWEDMTEERRREVYGESYEYRKLIYELRLARTTLALSERAAGAQDKNRARAGIEIITLSSEAEAYQKSLEEYEKKRAEYIGERFFRYSKERLRMADAKAGNYHEGRGRKFVKLWQKTSTEWNWQAAREKKGDTSGNFLTRLGRRCVSVRSAIGFGLMGAGQLVPGAGQILMAVRSSISGVGFGILSYESMRKYSEQKELEGITFDEATLSKMATPDIEQAMSQFEARAFFSGLRFPKDEGYQALIAEYRKRSRNEEVTVDKIKKLDQLLVNEEERLSREDKARIAKSIGLGVLGAVGLRVAAPHLHEKIVEGFHKLKDISSETYDTVVAGTYEALSKAPLVSDNDLVSHVENATKVSESVLSEANTTEVIQKEGSVWKAAHNLLEKGVITKDQFNEAWGSSASFYKTPGGNMIRIPDLDFVHPGTTVSFIAGSGDVPAHFEIGGNVAHIGDTNDLANAFRAAHKPMPEWIQDKLGIEHDIEEHNIPKHSMPITRTPTPEYSPASALRAHHAVEGLARGEYSVRRVPRSFSWGRVEYIVDRNGRVVDVNFRHFGGARRMNTLMRRAIHEHLRSDYEARISRSIPYYHESPEERIVEMRRRMYEVQNAAYQYKYLREALKYRHGSRERIPFIAQQIESITRSLSRAGLTDAFKQNTFRN